MVYIIIAVAILVIVACALILYLKSPKSRGKRGEDAVVCAIKSTNQGKYYLINDIILTDKNGMTHQIDHIVINKNGIFVIETKNYSGDIYGTENQREWTQVLAHGNTKNKLRNPVKQNASHIYCLREILPQAVFRPLVVFVQNNTSHIKAESVIPLLSLPSELTKPPYGQLLTEEQMITSYNKILTAKTDTTNKEHVNNIRKQQAALAKGVCPRCGSKLVVRQRKDGTGSFYGCSAYPKCRFTKNIE